MSRPAADWFVQIVRACDAGADLVARGREAFDHDDLLQRACRNICFEIGEAVKQISASDPAALRNTRFDRWSAIVRMRDFLAHNYPTTDVDVMWDTLSGDLPEIRVVVADLAGEAP